MDPAIAFGTLLPDFVNLLGLKTPPSRHEGIQVGYDLHHLTDALFHDLPAFRAAYREETALLRQLGFGRGPAAAIAHVGLEFLLDGTISTDKNARSLLRSSLSWATLDCLFCHIDWQCREHADGFEGLRQRLLSLGPPESPLDPCRVAERIVRTLRNRPKLAPGPEGQTLLVDWVLATSERRNGLFPTLFEPVLETLRIRLPIPLLRT